MTETKITEKRKRRTETYACDEERAKKDVRAKCIMFNRPILKRMCWGIYNDEFLKQMPVDVMYDFARKCWDMEHFLCRRNEYGKHEDIPWLSQTSLYKEAFEGYLEPKIQLAVRKVKSRQILRDYRLGNISLAVSVYHTHTHDDDMCFARRIGKRISLPRGSYVYVEQVLSTFVRVGLANPDDCNTPPPSLANAWNVVAGTPVIRGDPVDEREEQASWMNDRSRDDTELFSALSVIMNEPSKLTVSEYDGGISRLRLKCSLDETSSRGMRSIGFDFSSEHVKLSVDLPPGNI